jgi:formiminoglutamase
MDLSIYFESIKNKHLVNKSRLGSQITGFFEGDDFPNYSDSKVVLFGVKSNKTDADSDAIREYLYHLAAIETLKNVTDLGNIISSENLSDNGFAISDIITNLVKQNKIVVIIHGSRITTHGIYSAFAKLEQLINLTVVDQTVQLGDMSEALNDDNYLSKIMLSENNYLFNFCQLAHQSHFTGREQLDLLDRLNFDHIRLGALREHIEKSEPVFRNSDVTIFNLSSVRMSDSPGTEEAGPNGLFGEEYCRLARYAGVCDKTTVAGFFEYNSTYDQRGVSAHLQAQAIWYYLEGVSLRQEDFPIGTKENYTKYIIDSKDGGSIEFLKSNKSERWWITVPVPSGKQNKFFRHHLVPCTYGDYQLACNNELPDIWIKTLQKFG